MKIVILGLLALLLSSCAGYHFRRHSNPFVWYGVKSITVPMFVNQSILPNVAGPITKEIVMKLNRFPNLDVHVGETGDTDGVLVGIIYSSDELNNVLAPSGSSFTKGTLTDSIGARRNFYLPTTTTINLKLRLVLIKRPSFEELNAVQSNPNTPMRTAKIIFDKTLDLSHSFTLRAAERTTMDSAGVTNFTFNKSLIDKGIRTMAEDVAKTFQEVILDVF